MANGDDLEERLVGFAVTVIEVTRRLPRSPVGRHIGRQLVRSGTAPAARFAEARGAESRRDFVHKLRLSLKEMNETAIWLRISSRSKLIAPPLLLPLEQACTELSRILNDSVTTARARRLPPPRAGKSPPP